MLDLKHPEHITFVFSIIGGLGTFFSLMWVKVIKPAIKFVKGQEEVSKSLETIKNELTTNC